MQPTKIEKPNHFYDKLYNLMIDILEDAGHKIEEIDTSEFPNEVDELLLPALGITKSGSAYRSFKQSLDDEKMECAWADSPHAKTLLKAKLIQSGILTDKTLPT